MKKNTIKIILDIIMAVLLVLMYNKMAVSLTFHEAGGLLVCGLFLIHKSLNWDWIIGISKKLFKKSMPAKTRFCYFVNVLLLLSMTFIAVSGVMISKVVLTDISSQNVIWKQGHYFASALAIILVGVHTGLHWSFIKNTFAKLVKLPRVVAKPAGIIILIVVLGFGGYSLTTSSFARWISGPFAMLSEDFVEPHEGPGSGEFGGNRYGQTDSEEGLGKGSGGGLRAGRNHSESATIDFNQIMHVIATYGSITAVFGAITVWMDWSFMGTRKKKDLSPDPSF